MSNKEVKKSPKASVNTKALSKNNRNAVPIDHNPFIEKYFWIVIPVFAFVYYLSSKYSVGFYQDDEIGQYINMINFWSDPFVILGNSPKPGYKLIMVIPSLFGYETVLFVNSLIASLTVYFTYVLLKCYKIEYASFGALLLALQPLFFDLSFRSYAEIFTSLLIIFVLIFYKNEKYVISALICGYIFTVRQEIALLILIYAIIYFRKKNFTALICLAVFPVLYNLLGYFKTGDILFVLTEMSTLSSYNYKTQGVSHYFFVYIFIIGPVALLLFLFGYFGFLSDTKKFKEYLMKYDMFYIVFTSVFVVQLLTMFSDGPNPGNWRYLLHISPIAAAFATIGLNNASKPEFRKTIYILSGILIFITLVFLSKKSDGFKLLEITEYSKLMIVSVCFLLILLFKKEPLAEYLNKLSISFLIMSVIYLYLNFTPKMLTQENIALKQTSEYLKSIDINGKEIYFNHSFIPFYTDEVYRKNPDNYKRLIKENLKNAKPGSVIVWDTHYSYRPDDMKNDVKLDALQDTSKFKLHTRINSPDGRFAAFIFETK